MYRHRWVMLFLFFCACTVGPDYRHTDIYSDSAIKSELQLESVQKASLNWSEIFKDKQLETLVRQALSNNTDIATAVSRLQAARAKITANAAEYLPQADYSGSYNYNKSSGRNKIISPDSDYFRSGFDASWELDIWGKGRRQYEADTADYVSAHYNIDNIKLMIAAEIALNYVKMQQNLQNEAIARKNVKLQQDLLELVRVKYERGLADETSYREAEYLLAETEAKIPVYQNNIETYRRAISTIIGILPSQINIKNGVSKIIFSGENEDLSGRMASLPASVIRHRPDVRMAEQALIKQNALLGRAIADLYPDVSISALLVYIAPNTGNLFDSKNRVYGYSVPISMPLLDWNRIKSNIEIQSQEKQIAFNNYRQSVVSAINELGNAMSAYKYSLRLRNQSRKSLHSIKKVVVLTEDKYKNGLTDFSSVLNRQQDLLSAEEKYISAQAEVIRNIIAYLKAVGSLNN